MSTISTSPNGGLDDVSVRGEGAGRLLLFVMVSTQAFLSHRLPLALAARRAGYDVQLVTAPSSFNAEAESYGFKVHTVGLTRSGTRPWTELMGALDIWRLYRRLRPDIVHHVTVKPMLYGGFAARVAPVRSIVSGVTGLGYLFIAQGLKASIMRAVVKVAYRIALRRRGTRVIFQNYDDRDMFVGAGLVRPEDVVMIRGSGADLDHYAFTPEPEGIPLVVLASRMLLDKGVVEFVSAARRLRQAGVEARFALVGDGDPGNPTTVSPEQLVAWRDEGVVEWWGHRNDIPAVFSQAHLVVLPSYREGLPKVLIEAAACGRAIVAADVPGCREIVQHGVNGLLVPVREVDGLVEAIGHLLASPDERRNMGRRGRALVEAEFGIERVIRDTLAVYRELLS